jgi:starvation-inducible DNA-binding protein
VHTALEPAPDTIRASAVSGLQQLVPGLAALGLDAKQAHWNVTGPAFLPIHELADRIAADARDWTDRVAERVLALGYVVDGRAANVAQAARDFPPGRLSDREVIGELTLSIRHVIGAARNLLDTLERADPVAHDIVVEVLEGLEKHRWMLQAQKG